MDKKFGALLQLVWRAIKIMIHLEVIHKKVIKCSVSSLETRSTNAVCQDFTLSLFDFEVVEVLLYNSVVHQVLMIQYISIS